MRTIYKQRLGAELESRYNGCDVSVRLDGIVSLSLQINKLKSLVSGKTILLSDGVYEEMYIDSYSVSDVEVNKESIVINMARGSKITIKRIKEGKN